MSQGTHPGAHPHGAPPRVTAEAALGIIRADAKAALRLALMVSCVTTLLTFLAIWLKLDVYRLVVPTGSMPTAFGLVTGFMLVLAMLIALDHLRDLILLTAGNRLARGLSAPAVMAAAARLGEPATTTAALLSDAEEVRRALAGPFCTGLIDVVLVPVGILILWLLHPYFAVLAVLCCLLAGLVSLAAERRARASLTESNGLAGQTSALVTDAMRCAEAVEGMGMRPALERRWQRDMLRAGHRMHQAQELGRRMSAAGIALQGLAAGGAMLLGALISLRGEDLGVGLMLAMLLTGRVIEPFARIGGATQDWGNAHAAWARLTTTLGRAGEARGGTAYPCPDGRLVLEGLTYLHPGTPRPLLREVDLQMGPGEVVAIIGPPGSGKTTLLRLILGMHRPTAGGVFLDGHATAQWERADLARHMGYLPQDPALGDGTIAEAIARLSPNPNLRAVLHAARLAGADRMIAGLPLGYATPVGGGSESGLSMGQRQRVALARAVYGAPRLVVLDEPTAWLDSEGEAAVERMVARLRAAGIGVVLSSHRTGLVDAADRALVMGTGGTLRPVPAVSRAGGKVISFDAKPAA